MTQATASGSPEELRKIRRNRLVFIAWIAMVLAFGGVFANLTIKALNVRATTSSEFSKYVTDNHIGTAEISDDASGLQGDFCVLHLSNPVSSDQVEAKLMDWMEQYQDLDGGRSLTVEYAAPGSGKTTIVGDAVFNPDSHTVDLTINGDGHKRVVQKHVDWDTSGDAS